MTDPQDSNKPDVNDETTELEQVLTKDEIEQILRKLELDSNQGNRK